jgi:hypothetical protein
MSQSRVLRVLTIERFENPGSSFLVGMRFVGEWCCRDESERLEDLRLGIARVAASDVGHSSHIPFRTNHMCINIVTTIVRGQGVDQLALTKRARSNFDCPANLLGPFAQLRA